MASLIDAIDNKSSKPLIITEGKTDKIILEVAWCKLYPNLDIPYEVVSSGIQVDEDQRTGSAEVVRKILEHVSVFLQRKIIGVFDNDREGNERFKGLSNEVFESHSLSSIVRKHKEKEVYGLILPVPRERFLFFKENSLTQRYFVMEHYFSNEILEQFDLKGESILDTEVFELKGNKTRFANSCDALSPESFEKFRILFDKISELIG